MEMQQEFRVKPKVTLRLCLHVGEIFFEGGKVFGDGVYGQQHNLLLFSFTAKP
jgi:hypothetical protein